MNCRTSKIYIPGMNDFSFLSKNKRGLMKGKGIGTVLLDGGLGGSSSYDGVDDYMATTNVSPYRISGVGLGKSITSKLGKLIIQKPPIRKPKNINFSL